MKKIILTNDSDHGSLKRYKIIYDALNQNGLTVSTSLFCTMEDDGSKLAHHCYKGETMQLDDREILAFVKDMISCGHEFSYHGYSQISNTRKKFLDGIKIFEDLLGFKPSVYIEHGGAYGFHDEGMVKKETLSYLGSNEKSEYFVKDIVENYFDIVWSQQYLIEGNNSQTTKTFEKKGNIIFFNRVRNANILKYIDNLEVLICYTHFNYDGYSKSKYDWIPFFKSKNRKLESWSNQKQIFEAIKILKDLAKEKNAIFSTLNKIYKEYIN
ncbi:MAG: hypothetical protein NWS46_11045 [Cyclobacteriaceae bacterium]|nr:hypothetical protein [Cyclobacteriaceae bacterium]